MLFHGAKDYPVFVFVFFFYVTVLCVSVARIRDGAGGRVIALSAEIMSLEAGAFFFFWGTSSTERRLGTVQRIVFDHVKGKIHCQSISALSCSIHRQL